MKGGDSERAQAGPDQAINVGLIGCGLIGHAHAAGVLKSPGARLIAVADRDRARMEAYAIRYGAPAGYTEVGELLARSDLDVVIVCTPNDSHCAIVEAALAAGKHVMVQKPMARTVSEADRMIRAAERAGRTLMVAFCELFHPAFRKARDLIRQGAVGEVFLVATIFGWCKGATDSWKWDAAVAGGGFLIDGLIHHVASVLWMTGMECRTVYAETGTLASTATVEDTGMILLRGPRTMAQLGGSMRLREPSPQFGGSFKERVEVFGTRGTIQILPLERPSLRLYSEGGVVPAGVNGWIAPTLEWTPYDERSLSLHFNADEDPWVRLHRHFFRGIRGEERIESDGAFGRRVQSVIEAAYESARTRAVISLEAGDGRAGARG